MKPTFSIVIPVYNVENYLIECVNSLLQQEASDIELLLINDGSTDGSPAICDAFAASDCRVKVIHKENGGVSSARNVGLEHAASSYITFIDSDDFVTPDYIEILKIAVKCEADLYHFRNLEYVSKKKRYLIEDRIPNGIHSNLEEIYSAVAEHRFCLVWDKIFRKEIIEQYKIRFDQAVKYGEDLIFVMDYLKHTEKVYVMKEYPYMHRSNPESVRNNARVSYIDDLKTVYLRIREFIADKREAPYYFNRLRESMLWILAYSLIPGLVTQRIDGAVIKERMLQDNFYSDLVNFKYNTIDCNIFRILLQHHFYFMLSCYRFFRIRLVTLLKYRKIMKME